MENKTVLVIGGTGSWGYGLIGELLKGNSNTIKVLARNEFQMVTLARTFQSPKIEIVIGDIRDKDALSTACKGVDLIFHLAALKHVPICENMPCEAIETNVMGTKHVIAAAMEHKVDKVIYVSTDKAVNPDSTYGCTKLLGEKLILSANLGNQPTKFMVFRGGNLIGSAGSVIPLFERQISEKGWVTLTDEGMNRFFISISAASRLLIQLADRGMGGEIFIPAMCAVRIKDIARYLLKKHNLDEKNILVTGMRPGEKLEETLIFSQEREHLYRFTEDLFLIIQEDSHGLEAKGLIKKCETFAAHSGDALLSYDDAAKFLREAGV